MSTTSMPSTAPTTTTTTTTASQQQQQSDRRPVNPVLDDDDHHNNHPYTYSDEEEEEEDDNDPTTGTNAKSISTDPHNDDHAKKKKKGEPPPKFKAITAAQVRAATSRSGTTTMSNGGGKQQQSGKNNATSSLSSSNNLTVSQEIVDELLLVCSVMCSHDETTGAMVPVADCLNWCQDLQRVLRRDDDATRPICLLLGDWNVVPQKLVPLTMACRYDTTLVLTILKILVIVTKPLAPNTIRAARIPIDAKSRKVPASVLAEQMKLRDNAWKQAALLLQFKRALCRADFLQVLVSFTAAPLSKMGKSDRTEQDHLVLEVVLHLLRNLLQAQPLLQNNSDADNNQDAAAATHHQFLQLLEQELVLDILCCMAADMDQPTSPNAPYNLLVMEILQHLLLARPYYKLDHIVNGKKDDTTAKTAKEQPLKKARSQPSGRKASATFSSTTTSAAAGGALRGTLMRQRQTAQALRGTRHGNFGGSFVVGGGDKDSHDGDETKKNEAKTTTMMSTTQFAQATLGHTLVTSPPTTTNTTNSRAAVFVGAIANHSTSSSSATASTMAARQACAVLHRFATRFIRDCLGPWTKSIKNEFRRDSVRLEDGDRVVWFQLAAFWAEFWRRTTKPAQGGTGSILGPLIFSMDVFSFHLVHNAIDTFLQHKQYGKLASAVHLLREMMYLLQILYNSDDETEQMMAMGLMDRLFYGEEPLDRLSKLLSQWQPGQFSHAYAADLAELVHTQLKMLEAHAKACQDVVTSNNETRKNKRKKKDNSATPTDAITKMKMAAADFEVSHYFRKLVSPHTVYLYTQLLAHYSTNGARLNHRIVSFLLRVSQFTLHVPEAGDERNPILQTKPVTLEPLLFNVRMLWVLHFILNDKSVSDKTLLQFALRVVNRFAEAASSNALLVVEAAVKHAVPHRFCQAVSHSYVSEELIMLAERDILLEEQQQWREKEEENMELDQDEENDNSNESDSRHPGGNAGPRPLRKHVLEDSDDEGEVEFDDAVVEAVPNKRKVLEDDDEYDDDDAGDGEDNQNSKGEKARPVAKKSRLNIESDSEDDEEEGSTEAVENNENLNASEQEKIANEGTDGEEDSSDEPRGGGNEPRDEPKMTKESSIDTDDNHDDVQGNGASGATPSNDNVVSTGVAVSPLAKQNKAEELVSAAEENDHDALVDSDEE